MGYSLEFLGVKTLVEVVKIKAPYGATNVPKSLYSLLIMAVETENINAHELSEGIGFPVKQLPISYIPIPELYMQYLFPYKVHNNLEQSQWHYYNNFQGYPEMVRSIKANRDKYEIIRCDDNEAYIYNFYATAYSLLTCMTDLWIVWCNDEWEDFITVRKYEKPKMVPMLKKIYNNNNIYTQDGLDLDVLSRYISPQFAEILCYPFKDYKPYMLQDWGKKWDI